MNFFTTSDVNECESTELNGCGPDQVAECFNTHGSYACGCRPGYFGNGVLCKGKNYVVRD